MTTRTPPPRIIRVRLRSGVNGRVAVAFMKVPYSALYDLSEKLARLLSQRQIRWFRIDVATPEEIEVHRPSLVRWPEALRSMAPLTRIDFDA